MAEKVKLKDGGTVTIRPMRADDLERSFAFFKALPEEDRAYLRSDVTQRSVVRRRIQQMKKGNIHRLVALARDKIVADGALERETSEWQKHVGELRLIVARDYQRKGLGALMARELYKLAAAEKVEEILVRMMRPQQGARRIFRRLGFHEEIVLPDYVKDLKGHKQDLIVMRCDLEGLWQEMEEYLSLSDWQRTR
jgi:L-amino acid N-acyltransferase YncA